MVPVRAAPAYLLGIPKEFQAESPIFPAIARVIRRKHGGSVAVGLYVSPATASQSAEPADATLGEGREVTIASPGSPFDQLRGRIETVTESGYFFVSVPGKGFLQLHPAELKPA